MRSLEVVQLILNWEPQAFISTFPQTLYFHLIDVTTHSRKYVCGACATRDSRYDDSRYSSGSFLKQEDFQEVPDKVAAWMADHAEDHMRIAIWAISLDTQVWTPKK